MNTPRNPALPNPVRTGDRLRFRGPQHYFDYEREVAGDFLLPILRRHGVALKGARVLEVGCGYGGASCRLGQEGAEPSAFDTDAEALGQGAELPDARGIRFVRAVAEELPFRTASFDLALMHEVLEHLRAPAAGLREVARVLKPQAHLLLTFPPYYSAYGGHVKIKGLLYAPWNHLWFPRRWVYRLATRPGWCHISPDKQRNMMESENRMSLRKFERLLCELPFTVIYQRTYVLRPVFRKRYGTPVIPAGFLGKTPGLREILVTGCEYLLRKR